MSMLLQTISLLLMSVGCFFFLAGSVGMLRFPDVFTRLHASTKSDNLGLGLVLLGLCLQMDSGLAAAKLALIWALVIISGATVCHIVARAVLASGTKSGRPL